MPSNFSCPASVRRRRQGETLEGGANQVCRDQDGESLIRISGRDRAGTYLRFHTSPHARAFACACHARPSPPSSIRANHAIQRHCSARAYPSNSPRNHSRRTIYSDYFHYYMYIPFFIRGRTHTRMHPFVRRCAQYVPVDHASCCGNNSSSATLSASMLSASHKSICCMSCEATV